MERYVRFTAFGGLTVVALPVLCFVLGATVLGWTLTGMILAAAAFALLVARPGRRSSRRRRQRMADSG